MDVAALYPSVKKDMAAKVVMKGVEIADLEWENVDTKSLVRHIAMRYERNIINDLKLSEVVPVPESKTTFNSFINPRKN